MSSDCGEISNNILIHDNCIKAIIVMISIAVDTDLDEISIYLVWMFN